LGVTITDDEFHKLAQEGEVITLDIPGRTATVARQSFPFKLSEMEYNLTVNDGVAKSYRKYGKAIWEKFTGAGEEQKVDLDKEIVRAATEGAVGEKKGNENLQW
jgi:hypothetical protein